jgi:hypothetical protein
MELTQQQYEKIEDSLPLQRHYFASCAAIAPCFSF